jgi:hypothetical protein
MALEKLFLKTPHHKESAAHAPRPTASEHSIRQAATDPGIMGRLAEGALQERIAITVLPCHGTL